MFKYVWLTHAIFNSNLRTLFKMFLIFLLSKLPFKIILEKCLSLHLLVSLQLKIVSYWERKLLVNPFFDATILTVTVCTRSRSY